MNLEEYLLQKNEKNKINQLASLTILKAYLDKNSRYPIRTLIFDEKVINMYHNWTKKVSN